jgi:hypothetical protein
VSREAEGSETPWWRRPFPNRWLRTSVPALVIFGGMFVVRVVTKEMDDVALIYGVLAAVAVVGLAVGVRKTRHRLPD